MFSFDFALTFRLTATNLRMTYFFLLVEITVSFGEYSQESLNAVCLSEKTNENVSIRCTPCLTRLSLPRREDKGRSLNL